MVWVNWYSGNTCSLHLFDTVPSYFDAWESRAAFSLVSCVGYLVQTQVVLQNDSPSQSILFPCGVLLSYSSVLCIFLLPGSSWILFRFLWLEHFICDTVCFLCLIRWHRMSCVICGDSSWSMRPSILRLLLTFRLMFLSRMVFIWIVSRLINSCNTVIPPLNSFHTFFF